MRKGHVPTMRKLCIHMLLELFTLNVSDVFVLDKVHCLKSKTHFLCFHIHKTARQEMIKYNPCVHGYMCLLCLHIWTVTVELHCGFNLFSVCVYRRPRKVSSVW